MIGLYDPGSAKIDLVSNSSLLDLLYSPVFV